MYKDKNSFGAVLTQIYADQKKRSKKRGHEPPTYSKEELGEWIKKQSNFKELFKNWKLNKYLKGLKPSIDRLDDYKGYSFDNIQLITWGENNLKGRRSSKTLEKNAIQSKPVFCLDKLGNKFEFKSIKEASRETGAGRGNIYKCLIGERNSAGGFYWQYKNKSKILILGDARHGKDTLAEMICENGNLKFASSSQTALDIFLYEVLFKKYGLVYASREQAFEDRMNHRDKWFDEICLFNKEDKLKLTKEILKIADIYVGLRSNLEVEQAIKENTFSHIIGIYNYRKPRESNDSNTADVLKYSDFVILNNGDLDQLLHKVLNIVLKVI